MIFFGICSLRSVEEDRNVAEQLSLSKLYYGLLVFALRIYSLLYSSKSDHVKLVGKGTFRLLIACFGSRQIC